MTSQIQPKPVIQITMCHGSKLIRVNERSNGRRFIELNDKDVKELYDALRELVDGKDNNRDT